MFHVKVKSSRDTAKKKSKFSFLNLYYKDLKNIFKKSTALGWR